MSTIQQVTFDHAITLGPDMVPMSFVSQNLHLSGMTVNFEFDDDPRFLVIRFSTGGLIKFQQLIPISRIFSLSVIPDGYKTAKDAKVKKA